MLFGWTPRHLFKMWTTWNLPGGGSRWTLNAGVNAQSHFSGYTFDWLGAGPPRQGGYALWNASAQFHVTAWGQHYPIYPGTAAMDETGRAPLRERPCRLEAKLAGTMAPHDPVINI